MQRAICRRGPRAIARGVYRTATQSRRPLSDSSTASQKPASIVLRGPVQVALGIFIGGCIATGYGLSGQEAAGGSHASVDTVSAERLQQSPLPKSDGLQYADREIMLRAVNDIRGELGKELVSVEPDDIDNHGQSDWSTSNTPARPVAVVRPRSTEEVSRIAKICTRYKVPMIPYGAGSSVEGNFSSPFSGICIDMSAMDEIIAFHPDDMDVHVQAGVNWTKLNETIASTGLFLPLDPSPTALIGGMVSTNCSGTNATRYGTMKDYVVNLTVVLADGTVVKTRHRPRKTSAGYNLNALFVGSEGTLGIITEATLKLAIVPSHFSVATTTFPSIKDAADAACSMMRTGVPLAAVELMDDIQMRVINQNGGAGGRMWDEQPTLFLKFSGTESAVAQGTRRAKEVAETFNGQSFVSANNPAEMDSLWSARKTALWAMLAVRPEGTQIWSTDVAVPLSRMAELIDIQNSSLVAGSVQHHPRTCWRILGHVGDGNFHQAVMYDPRVPEQKRAVGDCVDSMMDTALEFEGTVSGEHGIGLGKKHCLAKELSPAALGLMKALKSTLDPNWLMNPGKVFDR